MIEKIACTNVFYATLTDMNPIVIDYDLSTGGYFN